jgi:carbon-monoxide dehydrogenase small subunit
MLRISASYSRGAGIVTIERLAKSDGSIDLDNEAFPDCSAIRCSFCIHGGIMMARDPLMNKSAKPSESEIREHSKESRCKCTGYTSIVKAIKSCSK